MTLRFLRALLLVLLASASSAEVLDGPHPCTQSPLREVCGDAVQFADATDHAALAAAIDAVLFDQDLRERHRRAGRARAAGFTWRACAEAHAQLYREVLA